MPTQSSNKHDLREFINLFQINCSCFFAFCFLLFALCFLLFALCSLLFALCSLLFALCSLLFAFCFLLFAFCFLLFIYFHGKGVDVFLITNLTPMSTIFSTLLNNTSCLMLDNCIHQGKCRARLFYVSCYC